MFCGSEHIPTERTQDAEKNSKLGIFTLKDLGASDCVRWVFRACARNLGVRGGRGDKSFSAGNMETLEENVRKRKERMIRQGRWSRETAESAKSFPHKQEGGSESDRGPI